MNRPPSIPQSYVFYKGAWCHPTRVPNPAYQNAPQTHAKAPPSDSVALGDAKTPKRIRQSSKPLLNKLEQEFYEVLKSRHSCYLADPTLCQSVRFRLANGIWYKPDFFVPPLSTAYEVKGPYAFRGGFENLKVAAHQFQGITWILVWKENGRWQEQVVLP